jgi:7-cyano-7-deazaguanine synthase in queuosine biosynthesis
MSARRALVLFSGGQDSATCLAWALSQPERFDGVETVAFGERRTRHAWGYGCGDCPACVLRARGHACWCASRPA